MRILRADDDVLLGDGWRAIPLSRCTDVEAAEARVVRECEPPKASLGRRRWLRTALLLPLWALLSLAGSTAAAPADLVWLDATGRPNASARDALRLLADAGADGLAPRDYRVAELAERAATLDTALGAAASPQPAFERDLDAAMRRYLHDLRLGRIDPRALGFRVARRGSAAPNFVALLHAAAAGWREGGGCASWSSTKRSLGGPVVGQR